MSNILPIYFSSRAKREIKKLTKKNEELYKKIDGAIKDVSRNPYHGSMKKGDLRGIYSIDIFDSGINYELAYKIEINEQGEMVLILLFGTRENFYKELKKYL